MDTDNICRLCLQTKETLLSVFSESLSQANIQEKVQKFLYLDIKSSDAITKSICLDCIRKIEDIHDFYLVVEQNQTKFVEVQATTHYQIIIEKNADNEAVTKQIINIQPYGINVHVKRDSFSPVSAIADLQFTDAAIIQNTQSSPQYQIMVIEESSAVEKSPQVDYIKDEEHLDSIENIRDIDDNESIASSTGNRRVDDYESSDEGHNSIEGFPKVIIQDAKLAIRGRELFQLMSKFYKLHCEICQEKDSVFVKLTTLLEHYEDMHSMKGYVKCCDIKLTKTRAMALHMARHVQPDAFKCPECRKMMTCPKILRYHIQNHLPEEKRPLACSKCPRRFSYSSALTAHGISHLPEDQRDSHICDECGKSFLTASRLSQHINTAHSMNMPRFVCHECGKQFSCKGNLTYHLTTHEQIHQVQCSVCHKWLKNKLCLRKHMTQHSEVRHQCASCSYSSVNLQCYRNHMRVQHSNDKPFTCSACGRNFKLKNTLLNHVVQHTGERKYSCEFCTRRFASSGNYYSHRKRMHPNELAQHNEKVAQEKEKAREIALRQTPKIGA